MFVKRLNLKHGLMTLILGNFVNTEGQWMEKMRRNQVRKLNVAANGEGGFRSLVKTD